jgi:hypothetical protein
MLSYGRRHASGPASPPSARPLKALAAVRKRIPKEAAMSPLAPRNQAANMVHTHAMEDEAIEDPHAAPWNASPSARLGRTDGTSDLRKRNARYPPRLPLQVATDMIDGRSIAAVERLERRILTPSFATCKIIDKIKASGVGPRRIACLRKLMSLL